MSSLSKTEQQIEEATYAERRQFDWSYEVIDEVPVPAFAMCKEELGKNYHFIVNDYGPTSRPFALSAWQFDDEPGSEYLIGYYDTAEQAFMTAENMIDFMINVVRI